MVKFRRGEVLTGGGKLDPYAENLAHILLIYFANHAILRRKFLIYKFFFQKNLKNFFSLELPDSQSKSIKYGSNILPPVRTLSDIFRLRACERLVLSQRDISA